MTTCPCGRNEHWKRLSLKTVARLEGRALDGTPAVDCVAIDEHNLIHEVRCLMAEKATLAQELTAARAEATEAKKHLRKVLASIERHTFCRNPAWMTVRDFAAAFLAKGE